jgi:hypothetical protein
MTVKTQQFYYNLLLQGYMFRLLRVIIRPSNELIQDYVILSALRDPVALTTYTTITQPIVSVTGPLSALGIRQSWFSSLEGLMMTLRSRNM